MKDYIVLDIESPNKFTRSVSAIGIVTIQNNKKINEIYSLINPEDIFEDDIIELTNITPEMVMDAPKFNEYWKKIEKLLLKYPIIGHNIKYDLTVISRTLERYGMKVPDFEYICTLNLSRKYLNFDDNSLNSIMKNLNVDYNAHNALEDAEATFYLFQYLEKFKEQSILDTHKFHLKTDAKKEIHDDITPDLNELYGMLQELKYKEEIKDNHLTLLKEWIDKNSENNKYKDVSDIITKLDYIIHKTKLNKKEMNQLGTIANSVSKSEIYSKEELNSQVLTGILKMIQCDKKITQKEYDFLEKWLAYYELPKTVNKEEILSTVIIK